MRSLSYAQGARQKENKNKNQRTTDSSLSILFVPCSPSPLLDAFEEPLSYPIPPTFPFLFNAFALQLVRRLGALESIPFFHCQLREQRRALEGKRVQAKRI
jgi:hypothetical protein